MRHANPDLIVDSELEARVGQVLDYLRHPAPAEAPLERVTLFLTDRCNLACRYCNGPHLARNEALHHGACLPPMSAATYYAWLEAWAAAGLKHLHFTGGEPVTHPQLPAFIRAARAKGVLCSVTSNGTLPYKRYARLLKAGLTELRISIDSARPRAIDAIVGRPGAGRRLLGNLRALLRLRARGRRDFWLVLNSCLDRYDPRELWKRLDSLRRLGPDDIKVLVVAQDRTSLRQAARRDTVAKLLRAVDAWDGYPLLKRKLKDMFRRDAAGLRDPVVRQVAKTCVVPLLERTLDESGLYPCSIYKRHAGAPIAPASLDPAAQQAAIAAWTRSHDCRQDPICIRHCVGCTKQLNVDANRRLDAFHSPVVAPVEVPAGLWERPYLVVKPLGLPHLKGILRYLRSQRVGLRAALRLGHWQDLAARVHGRLPGCAEARAFGALEDGDEACWLQLEGPLPWGQLARFKRELRELYPGRQVTLDLNDAPRRLRATVVHGPDPGAEDKEWQMLSAQKLAHC